MMMIGWGPKEVDPPRMQVSDNTDWVPDEAVENQPQPRMGTPEGLEFLSFSSRTLFLHRTFRDLLVEVLRNNKSKKRHRLISMF